MNGFGLAWLIIGLPLLGALVQGVVGGWVLGGRSAGPTRLLLAILAVLPIFLAFGLGLALLNQLVGLPEASRTLHVGGPNWISLGGLQIPFELQVDPLAIVMVLVITGVGGLIHLYSTGYMAAERDYSRFFAYLNLFVAAMLLLVLAGNLPLLFVGWEGVGLCSYLLIGFWHEDPNNVRAANKAFIVNRVGDWGLLLGMFLIVATLVSGGLGAGRLLSFDVALPALGRMLEANPAPATAIALLLFIGAAGKSAQFPLHIWLPDAMAGPTPVSALIHAATMVTSGVVLLTRFAVVFSASPLASAIICVIGAFTALYAAIVAFGQTDIKRVLAWSTVSQLGFMFLACGAGAYWAGMFHVVTHAFFKALLFLGAGAVIHAMAHEQDMRRYGRLAKYLPLTMVTMLMGTLAISGVPFFSGGYSKEAILVSAFATSQAQLDGVHIAMGAGWVGLLTALLTAAYMARLMMLTFFGNRERWRDLAPVHEDALAEDHHEALAPNHRPHEVGFAMAIPLVVLAILSVFGGIVLEHGEQFRHFISPRVGVVITENTGTVPVVALTIAAALLGLIFGALAYRKGLPLSEGEDESKWSPWRRAARNQFGFDAAVTSAAVAGGGDLARGLDSGVDSALVGGGYGGGIAAVDLFGRVLKRIQSGYVRTYALVMMIGVVAILGTLAILSSRGGLH